MLALRIAIAAGVTALVVDLTLAREPVVSARAKNCWSIGTIEAKYSPSDFRVGSRPQRNEIPDCGPLRG
jgi:hypothetical protein